MTPRHETSPTAAQRASLEAALEEEGRRAATRIRALERNFEDIAEYSEGSPPDDEHDPEGATVAFERAQVTALLRQAEDHLASVRAALARLHEGSYGICEGCGEPIPLERLMARPTAQRCVACM